MPVSNTGTGRTQQSSLQEGSWSTWTHQSLQNVLERRVCRPLPPWTEAFSLVKEFFDDEHKGFPCFHPPTFMTLFGQQYSSASSVSSSPAWWVSLNAVLAIAQRRRMEKSDRHSQKDDAAWGYAANAMGAVLDVLMRNTQLISVQALLSIAWFMKGTPNPQPSFMLVASALRLAQSIGLHKGHCDSSIDPTEQSVRDKVFWIAFSLDRELCLRTGRPPAQDLDDFEVDTPQTSPDDDSEKLSLMKGSTMPIFESIARLSLVQSRIYQKLYSTRQTTGQSDFGTDCIPELNNQLKEWCSALSPSFDPEQPPGLGEDAALIRLFYSYYNCVIATHRTHCREYWMPLKVPIAPTLSISRATSIQRCLKAARAIAQLDHAVPRTWKSFTW